jgi:ABC-type multidrug transport system ATPase subunit
MLSFQELTKIYPIKVPGLVKATGEVQAGQTIGVLGAYGAGKTTLLKLLAGLERPTNGQILWDEALQALPKPQRLGFMPCGFAFPPDMKPREWLLYVAALQGLKVEQAKARVEELITLSQLETWLDKPFPLLNRLAKQTVAYAQSQILAPPLLLMDEPLLELDYRMAGRFWQMVQASRPQGQAIVFTAKRRSDLPPFTDLVLLLEHGNLRWTRPMNSLSAHELDLLDER